MKRKYTIGGLAALLVLLAVWILVRRQDATGGSFGINLSYNVCVSPDAGYQVIENDSLVSSRYVGQYWADTTKQFFSKTLLAPAGDTLLVSVFNQSSLRQAGAMLGAAGFENKQQQKVAHPDFDILLLLDRTPGGPFFLRRLIADKQFQVVVMVDQWSRDSTALRQIFQKDPFIPSLEKCL